MLDKLEVNTLYRIMQEGNAFLDAGIIENSLRLRLTVSESTDIVKKYIG